MMFVADAFTIFGAGFVFGVLTVFVAIWIFIKWND